MFDNGLVEKLDYDRAELYYNNQVVAKENTEREIKLAYAFLKFQMGMDQSEDLQLTDQLDESKWTDMSTADQLDYTKRNEYSLMQTRERFEELDLKRYR